MIEALAIAVAVSVVPSCSWDNPGANPFTGNRPASVQSYTDIPKATRDRLQRRMTALKYDDVAAIGRDSIQGKHDYTDLRDMHFGKNRICSTISRDKWKPDATERGLVYCEDGHCIIVPTVCGNVSRVSRISPPLAPPTNTPGAPGTSGGGDITGLPLIPLVPGGGGLTPLDLPFVQFSPTPITEPNSPGSFGLGAVPLPFYTYSPPQTLFIPLVTPPIPEPGTWALMIAGLAGLVAYTRRRKV